MFEIKCEICEKIVIFKEGVNNEKEISITGEVEVLSGADIFLSCACGNEITIKKS